MKYHGQLCKQCETTLKYEDNTCVECHRRYNKKYYENKKRESKPKVIGSWQV